MSCSTVILMCFFLREKVINKTCYSSVFISELSCKLVDSWSIISKSASSLSWSKDSNSLFYCNISKNLIHSIQDSSSVRVFNKKWSRWQNLRSRQRDIERRRRRKLLGGSGGMPPGKFWKFGSLRMHFPHSGAWIRLFEQNTDIINFGLFLFNGTQKL